MKSLVILLIGLLLTSKNLWSEESKDPNDLWYRGFLATKSAEELIRQEKSIAGLSALDDAFRLYKQITLEHPEFNAELVKDRLQLTAENRFQLIRTMRDGDSLEKDGSAALKKLEEELDGLKNQLRKLRERRKLLDRELYDLKGAGSEINLGFHLDWQGRIQLPRFHERIDDREESLNSGVFLESELFPDGRLKLEDENGTTIVIEKPTASPGTIPDNWIPRLCNGEMTYLIPLVETPATRRFSKIIQVPTALRDLEK